MSSVDIGEVVLITLVFVIGVLGIIKVAILDDKKSK